VRDGIQQRDQRSRQRWRCSAPDGTFHWFLGASSVTRVEAGVCPTCERHHGPAEGTSTPWRHACLVREMVTALVAIGDRASYTDTAERLKTQVWGEASVASQAQCQHQRRFGGGLVASVRARCS
jgi:hypothetical protein